MKRHAVARWSAGPLVIAQHSDRPGWRVFKPATNGQLRQFWPIVFRTLPDAYHDVEQHLGRVLTWRLDKPPPKPSSTDTQGPA